MCCTWHYKNQREVQNLSVRLFSVDGFERPFEDKFLRTLVCILCSVCFHFVGTQLSYSQTCYLCKMYRVKHPLLSIGLYHE